jgi:aryl-alcohol dehydrogenase-like predicted oxidoreductase
METRVLGNTDMAITPVGFGAWAIGGGGWVGGWGSQEDADSIAAIHRALDEGVNWIDTAAAYGIGRSEQVVGKALAGRGERPYIFTKCGLIGDEQGNVTNVLKPDSIRREAEASLRRLGVDAIDLYQIHWPDPDRDIEAAWTTMAELQAKGLVRHIGVSNFNVPQMERAMRIAPIASLQPPYSLIRRDVEQEILPFCQRHGIGVIVYSPMQSGLLTGAMTRERIDAMPDDDWRRRDAEYQEPKLSQNLALVERLREVGRRHRRSPGEVAVAWVLRRPDVTGAIVGARRPDQVSGVVGAGDLRLTADELAFIEEPLDASDGLGERSVGA